MWYLDNLMAFKVDCHACNNYILVHFGELESYAELNFPSINCHAKGHQQYNVLE